MQELSRLLVCVALVNTSSFSCVFSPPPPKRQVPTNVPQSRSLVFLVAMKPRTQGDD